MTQVLWGLVGVVIGAVVVVVVVILRRRMERGIAERLLEETKKDKTQELSVLIEQLKTSFAALSRDALSANTDDFLKLARTRLEQQTAHADQTLEAKKKLIDARVEEIGTKLNHLNDLIQRIELQRVEAHGSLTGQLEKATQATHRLYETTSQLRQALANPQRRGQWGERMAEDVLRLAGFVEGVNYHKQKKVTEGGIPDFTFLFPDNRRIHMDVKFPLANYLKMLDAPDDVTRITCARGFLKDVRSRLREVTTRAYIDPAAGTVDYCLMFIPNEQIYGFIHEQDGTLLDDALRQKVVLCSPQTLYAILAVIRQSVENFRLEQASRQILDLLSEFKKQWAKYLEGMDRMGKRLEDAGNEYQQLVNTRTRQLDRQLDKIDNLRAAREEQATTRQPPAT